MIFAKALNKVEEIFKNDSVIKEIVNTNEIFKKLVDFLTKSIGKCFNIKTFKLLLTALENFIDIRESSNNKGIDEDQRKEIEEEELVNQ